MNLVGNNAIPTVLYRCIRTRTLYHPTKKRLSRLSNGYSIFWHVAVEYVADRIPLLSSESIYTLVLRIVRCMHTFEKGQLWCHTTQN